MQPFAEHTLLLVAGSVLLDLIIGDPKWLPHPVILFGKVIRLAEGSLNKGEGRKVKGIILAVCLPAAVFITSLLLLKWLYSIHCAAGLCAEIYLISTTMAIKGLKKAALEVYTPLAAGNLSQARKKLNEIVGRDTADLPSGEITRGAAETVAENTVDAIISPLVFAILGGAPLALAYRAVNTLDSMVGYKNERYRDFGFGSARLDDLMNLFPARLCALCMWVSSFFIRGMKRRNGWQITRRDAKKHPSPNSGWPEAMTAGLLGIQLGGTNTYSGAVSHRAKLGDAQSSLLPVHIKQSIHIMNGAWLVFLAIYLCLFMLRRMYYVAAAWG